MNRRVSDLLEGVNGATAVVLVATIAVVLRLGRRFGARTTGAATSPEVPGRDQ